MISGSAMPCPSAQLGFGAGETCLQWGHRTGGKRFWKGQGGVKDTLEFCVSPAVSPRRVGGFPWLGGASVAVLTAALCSRGHPGAPPAPARLS